MKVMEPVVAAATTRLGTFLSATFLGWGLQAEHVNLVVPAMLVLVGVGVDMVTGYVVKRMGH